MHRFTALQSLVYWRSLRGLQSSGQITEDRTNFTVRLARYGAMEVIVGFIAWIVVGLIAGWLAGQVMKGGGYGTIADIVLGLLGGVLGGWVFGLLGIGSGSSMLGSIIVAFVGAVILVSITRALKKA